MYSILIGYLKKCRRRHLSRTSVLRTRLGGDGSAQRWAGPTANQNVLSPGPAQRWAGPTANQNCSPPGLKSLFFLTNRKVFFNFRPIASRAANQSRRRITPPKRGFFSKRLVIGSGEKARLLLATNGKVTTRQKSRPNYTRPDNFSGIILDLYFLI